MTRMLERAAARGDAPHHRARHGRGLLPRRSRHRAPLRRGADRGHLRRGQGAIRASTTSTSGQRCDALDLAVEGIHTYYGDSHVLHGVSLRVAAGEAVALLGRNGAGKTTLIRSIVGLHAAARRAASCLDGEADRGVARPPHRAPRHRAGAAGAAHLRAAHGAGESPRSARARPRAGRSSASTTSSRASGSARSRRAARCRAASSRCWPSAARS